MIRYRPFRNSDPPALAEIWRTRSLDRGLVQPMSADLFEQHVLAKPYFENAGLIVALDDDRPIGFAHSGFGPNEDESSLSTQLGVISMLMIRSNYKHSGVANELLAHSEHYLRDRGSEVLYGGGVRPLTPFYLGLYGGSELPGVLDSHVGVQRLFRTQDYDEIDRIHVLRRDLAGFRPAIDRKQMQIRRRTSVEVVADPRARTWWQACTWGAFDRFRFDLRDSQSGQTLAEAMFWRLEPLATGWGVRAMGLSELWVADEHRREGLATYLVGEALRQIQSRQLGIETIAFVEAQTMCHNGSALKLYEKLGFKVIDQGAVYRKRSG